MPAIPLRPGQPLLVGPGVALPPSTFPVQQGYVRLTTVSGAALMSLDVVTTSEPSLVSDSYAGGWDTFQRPNSVELPVWRGGKLLRQTIPLTMDVLKWPGLDIDAEWKALRGLARPPHGKRPPVLKLSGPVDHPEVQWTIAGLDIDAESTKRRGNLMVRQSVAVTLQQWLSPDLTDVLEKTSAAADRPRRAHFTAAVNTTRELAKREHTTWQKIRDTPGNRGMGDPDHKYAPGTVVWLPPK